MDIIFNYFLFKLWAYLNNIDNARHAPALGSNDKILKHLNNMLGNSQHIIYSRNADFSQMRNQNFVNIEIEVLD